MIRRIIITILISSVCAYSEPKDIPQVVVDAIKDNECLKLKGINENNFIRINRTKDIAKAKSNGFKMYKKYLIRCNNPKQCSETTKELLSIGIKNMDLGPYQINYYYQNSNWDDNDDYSSYFKEEEAEKRAREILWSLIDKYGYSWRTIGRYHHYDSRNKTRNRKYYGRLYKYVYGFDAPSLLTSN